MSQLSIILLFSLCHPCFLSLVRCFPSFFWGQSSSHIFDYNIIYASALVLFYELFWTKDVLKACAITVEKNRPLFDTRSFHHLYFSRRPYLHQKSA